MILNANLLRIAHAFLRDADDVVTLLHANAPEPGVIMTAENGHAVIVIHDVDGEIDEPCSVRLDKGALQIVSKVKDKGQSLFIDEVDCTFETYEPSYMGKCHVRNSLDHIDARGAVDAAISGVSSSSREVLFGAQLLGLLAKTAEELAVHHGAKKTDASMSLLANNVTGPTLVRFSVPDAVAVVMPRLGDDGVPSVQEIARWAL